MKNHRIIEGKLLQTNKNWSQLKESQKTWIFEQIKNEHSEFIKRYGRLPVQKSKTIVLSAVWDLIIEREIWILCCEYEINARKMIDRLNRRHSLFKKF
jgi:hypothetical protein